MNYRFRGVWMSIVCLAICAATAHAQTIRTDSRGSNTRASAHERRDAGVLARPERPEYRDAGDMQHVRRRPMNTTERTRRRAGVAAIRRKVGNDLLQRDDVKAEFNLHAWRLARLRRAVLTAGELKDETLRGKALELLKRETERHERRLAQLRAESLSANGGAPPRSAPSSIPATTSHR